MNNEELAKQAITHLTAARKQIAEARVILSRITQSTKLSKNNEIRGVFDSMNDITGGIYILENEVKSKLVPKGEEKEYPYKWDLKSEESVNLYAPQDAVFVIVQKQHTAYLAAEKIEEEHARTKYTVMINKKPFAKALNFERYYIGMAILNTEDPPYHIYVKPTEKR